MTTLFLDFASHRKSAALVNSGKTAGSIAIDDHAKESELIPCLEGMLKSAGVQMADLERIAATVGPGGFMSLRVGLSLANALAWSLKIPVGGIHLSDLWHARMKEEIDALWLHSTKKELLFVRGFGSLAKEINEPTLVKFDELKADIRGSADFVGELIPEHAKSLPVTMAEGLRTLEEVLPAALEKLKYGQPPLLPWYGRGI